MKRIYMEEKFNIEKWKPKNWLGSLQEWRDIVGLEYIISQGYGNLENDKEYKKLHLKGWFGK